ncbi:MAG TPA: hypothetical protein VGL89_08645 [Candidatus Koribacter sp.]|jgi:hypothetical protein
MSTFAKMMGVLLMSCAALIAQTSDALRQSFHAPKADVEQALKDVNASQGGRLPFLEGFVGAINDPLANFQRAYYQYTVDVQQVSESEVSVSVNAKISAWYEDSKDKSKSGYRDLPSSGRLEADLLDRVSTQLREHAADVAANRVPLVSPKLLGTEIEPPAAAASSPSSTIPASPDAPTSSTATRSSSAFKSYGSTRALAPPSVAPEQDPHYQRLVQEETSLREVIGAQQRPDNLVAVKNAHTPIVSSPAEGARVLMYADAEDEFQFLKNEGEWTHVQIAGLNRGWIRTSNLEKPGAAAAVKVAEKAGEAPAFQQTKEETSTFPGDWEPLRGKNVKIIWVQPQGKSTQSSRLTYVKSVFKKQAPELAHESGVDGVVVVFDAADGGMAATTSQALAQWGNGSLTDPAFLKQCWFDPADAFPAAAR